MDTPSQSTVTVHYTSYAGYTDAAKTVLAALSPEGPVPLMMQLVLSDSCAHFMERLGYQIPDAAIGPLDDREGTDYKGIAVLYERLPPVLRDKTERILAVTGWEYSVIMADFILGEYPTQPTMAAMAAAMRALFREMLAAPTVTPAVRSLVLDLVMSAHYPANDTSEPFLSLIAAIIHSGPLSPEGDAAVIPDPRLVEGSHAVVAGDDHGWEGEASDEWTSQ